jgi:hypothetical protein
MPQTTSKIGGFAFRDVGKGQAHELTLEGCIAIWKRAEMRNHREQGNLRMRHDYITRHAQMLAEKQKRTVAKLEKSLETTRAYHSLVQNDFKIDNFDTLTWGYKMPDPKKEPERFKRFVYETRIYHSGFTVQALRREVNKRMAEMKSDRINELARTKQMERMKRLCVVELFDRKKSLTRILEEHRDSGGRMRMRMRKVPTVIARKRTYRTSSDVDGDGDDINNQDEDDDEDSDSDCTVY